MARWDSNQKPIRQILNIWAVFPILYYSMAENRWVEEKKDVVCAHRSLHAKDLIEKNLQSYLHVSMAGVFTPD